MKIAFAVALLVQAQQALGRIVPPIDFSHPKIKDINADVFNQTIAKGIWLVEFFAPRCSHCQEFQPHIIKAVEKYYPLEETDDFHFGHVNCRENRQFCEEQSIDAFPGLYVYLNGERKEEFLGSLNYEALEKLIQDALKKYTKQRSAEEQKQIAKSADDKAAVGEPVPSKEPPAALTAINPDGKVIALDKESFKQLTRRGPWMIKFFAPWCGHCKELAPTWEKFGEHSTGLMNVGAVDCTEHGVLCQENRVTGYPTLKLFIDGEFEENYKGMRTLDALINYAKIMAKPSIISITASELDGIRKTAEVNFLFLGPTVPDVLEILARKNTELCAIYKSADLDIYEEYSLDAKKPHLLLLRDNEVFRFNSDSFDDVERIKKWFNAHKFPALVQLTSSNANELFNQQRYVVLGFFDSSKPRLQEQVDRLRQISKSAKNRIRSQTLFAWIDAVKWAKYCRTIFGVEIRDVPTAVVVHPNGEQFYDRMEDGLRFDTTEEGLLAGVEAAIEGRLKATNLNGFFSSLSNFFMSITSVAANNLILVVFVFVAGVALLYWISREAEAPSRQAKAD